MLSWHFINYISPPSITFHSLFFLQLSDLTYLPTSLPVLYTSLCFAVSICNCLNLYHNHLSCSIKLHFNHLLCRYFCGTCIRTITDCKQMTVYSDIFDKPLYKRGNYVSCSLSLAVSSLAVSSLAFRQ